MTSVRIPIEPIRPQPDAVPPRRGLAPWIPGAWVLFFIASSFKWSGHRDVNEAVSGVASIENLIELAIYGVVGILAGLRLVVRTPRMRPVGVLLLGAYAALSLASAMWSLIPLFTLVRALQLIVLALLVAVTAGLWTEGDRSFLTDWRRIWITYLLLVLVFSIAGFIWPNWQSGRYAWPYLHTGTTGDYLMVASMVSLSMLFERGWGVRRWFIRLLPLYLAGSITLLMLTVTRNALFGFIIGATLLVATASRIRVDVRLLTVVGLVTLVVAGFAWFSEAVLGYVMRGQTTDQFLSFTGRTELWAFAYEHIRESPLLGFGLGAARVILTEGFIWGGIAHNLWIEAALSTGYIGAILLTALLLWMLVRSVRLQQLDPGPVSNLGAGFVSATLVSGFASTSLALPGLSFAVMGLFVAGLSVESAFAPREPTAGQDGAGPPIVAS